MEININGKWNQKGNVSINGDITQVNTISIENSINIKSKNGVVSEMKNVKFIEDTVDFGSGFTMDGYVKGSNDGLNDILLRQKGVYKSVNIFDPTKLYLSSNKLIIGIKLASVEGQYLFPGSI